MSTAELIAIILTSSLISTLVAFVLRYVFESKQRYFLEKEIENLRYKYELDLEKLKTELSIGASIQQEIFDRRLQIFPKLAELIYRTRNMARELISQKNFSSLLAEELHIRTNELENNLYRYRIDLEIDGIFTQIHAYKNLLRSFDLTLKEIVYFQHQDCEQVKIEDAIKKLIETYQTIDLLQKSLISTISESATKVETDLQDNQ